MGKKNNSIKQILQTLSDFEYLTENEVFKLTFGYDRNAGWGSNKRYADMIRRGLVKGFIGRANNKVAKHRENIGKATFVYFLKPEGENFLGK